MPVSDTDDTTGPQRPMLILGEDLPDLEDTTPEELRRQQEEARKEIERQRRELQEEIDRKRREAEREIAELEERTARELRERELELERTQKKLYRRESQLLRKARKPGTATPKRIVPRPPSRPLAETGLRGRASGIVLAALAAVGLALGGLTAGPSGDAELGQELSSADQARVLWLQSGLEADEAIARRMAGLPVGTGAEGSLPGAALVREATTLYPDSRYYGERVTDRTEEMLAEDTSPVRSLTAWSQVHDEASYAVGSWDVSQLREEATSEGSGPAVAVGLGLAALLLLLAMAIGARSWPAVGALVVAAGLAVAMFPAMSTGVSRDVNQAAQDHDAAEHDLDRIYSRVGQDLKAAYGISTSSSAFRSEYWLDDPFYDVERTAELGAYVEAREAVGEAEGETATQAAAVELVAAGRAAFDARVPDLEDARARMMTGLEQTAGRAVPLLLGLGSAGLVLTGLLLSRGRREG
jgi:hypothetical protein